MSLSLSDVKLFNDLVLLSKNHYGQKHNSRVGALRLMQIWVGSIHSRYRDAFEVYLRIYVQTRAFKNLGYTRMASMISRMVVTEHSLFQEPDSLLRAIDVLMATLAMTHRDDFGYEENVFPQTDPAIQNELDKRYLEGFQDTVYTATELNISPRNGA